MTGLVVLDYFLIKRKNRLAHDKRTNQKRAYLPKWRVLKSGKSNNIRRVSFSPQFLFMFDSDAAYCEFGKPAIYNGVVQIGRD